MKTSSLLKVCIFGTVTLVSAIYLGHKLLSHNGTPGGKKNDMKEKKNNVQGERTDPGKTESVNDLEETNEVHEPIVVSDNRKEDEILESFRRVMLERVLVPKNKKEIKSRNDLLELFVRTATISIIGPEIYDKEVLKRLPKNVTEFIDIALKTKTFAEVNAFLKECNQKPLPLNKSNKKKGNNKEMVEA